MADKARYCIRCCLDWMVSSTTRPKSTGVSASAFMGALRSQGFQAAEWHQSCPDRDAPAAFARLIELLGIEYADPSFESRRRCQSCSVEVPCNTAKTGTIRIWPGGGLVPESMTERPSQYRCTVCSADRIQPVRSSLRCSEFLALEWQPEPNEPQPAVQPQFELSSDTINAQYTLMGVIWRSDGDASSSGHWWVSLAQPNTGRWVTVDDANIVETNQLISAPPTAQSPAAVAVLRVYFRTQYREQLGAVSPFLPPEPTVVITSSQQTVHLPVTPVRDTLSPMYTPGGDSDVNLDGGSDGQSMASHAVTPQDSPTQPIDDSADNGSLVVSDDRTQMHRSLSDTMGVPPAQPTPRSQPLSLASV